MKKDYHMRACCKSVDSCAGHEVRWNDVERSYAGGDAFPSLKTGLDFIDRPWLEYERE